jgi:hypothetical protein
VTADTTTELVRGKGSYFAPGGSIEKEPVASESSNTKDQVEKDLEDKILTKEFIAKYAENNLIDLTKRSYVGPFEFLVYKHIGRNMLYFLQRINPEEKEAKYRLQMCIPAAGNLPLQ